jgi:hypothetical protein
MVRLRVLLTFGLLWLATILPSAAQTTAFSYQGRLTDTGNPANGNFDMTFGLFDAQSGGLQQGSTLTRNGVAVTAGLFSVTLDFGIGALIDGADRWLQIGVRPAGGGGGYSVLAPRQQLASSPYAVQTLNAQNLGGLPASRYVQYDNANNVGIGTAAPASKVHIVSGLPQTTPRLESTGTIGYAAGWDFYHGASPLGYVGAPDPSAGVGGNEVIVFGSTNVPVSLWANGTRALTVATSGAIGINQPSPTARLDVQTGTNTAVFGSSNSGTGLHGLSQSYLAVYGKSTSFEGVRGETNGSGTAGVAGYNLSGGAGIGVFGSSPYGAGVHGDASDGSGNGVFGVSSSGNGVFGKSTTGSGVYGETSTSSITAAGVYGKGLASSAIGVIGEANFNAATGVFGVSASQFGFGMYARNLSGGAALYVDGKALQPRQYGGMVKAMVKLNSDGTIAQCYNGVTGASSGNCGLAASRYAAGSYVVYFPFQVDDRFINGTALPGGNCYTGEFGLNAVSATQVSVSTRCVGSYVDAPTYLFVY